MDGRSSDQRHSLISPVFTIFSEPFLLKNSPAQQMPATVQLPVLETDVLVAGAGTAGCTAAIAAARQGASVILIEKPPVSGGVPHEQKIDGWRRHRQRCKRMEPVSNWLHTMLQKFGSA